MNTSQIISIGCIQMKSKEVIFIAGCPGAGKNTMAEKYILEHKDYAHLSMGDIYRHIATNEFKSRFRDTLYEDVRQKRLSSAETTTGVLFEAIEQNDSPNYIVSGFPHHMSEIKEFKKMSELYDISYSDVIFFDVSQQNAIQRMVSRGIRPMEMLKMHDNETVSAYYTRRYNDYMQQLPHLLAVLNSAYDVKHINANVTIEQVYSQFCAAIGPIGKSQRAK